MAKVEGRPRELRRNSHSSTISTNVSSGLKSGTNSLRLELEENILKEMVGEDNAKLADFRQCGKKKHLLTRKRRSLSYSGSFTGSILSRKRRGSKGSISRRFRKSKKYYASTSWREIIIYQKLVSLIEQMREGGLKKEKYELIALQLTFPDVNGEILKEMLPSVDYDVQYLCQWLAMKGWGKLPADLS